MNPHEQAVENALATAEELRAIFDSLADSATGRGGILSAYRAAVQVIEQAEEGNDTVMLWTLGQLRGTIVLTVQSALARSAQLGATQAESDLRAWDAPNVITDLAALAVADAVAAISATVDAQIAKARLLIRGGAERSLIVGDGTVAGVLQPFQVAREAARWSVATTAEAYAETARQSVGTAAPQYGRQAVAAIDERTTDCCLRVNGQIVPLDGLFQLTGTPQFAPEMASPPFHWYCRTATALVFLPRADDALTQRMRAAGAAELEARERTKTRVEINPASATSGRG